MQPSPVAPDAFLSFIYKLNAHRPATGLRIISKPKIEAERTSLPIITIVLLFKRVLLIKPSPCFIPKIG